MDYSTTPRSSDTPRTDDAIKKYGQYIHFSVVKELELQLNEANRQIDCWKELFQRQKEEYEKQYGKPYYGMGEPPE